MSKEIILKDAVCLSPFSILEKIADRNGWIVKEHTNNELAIDIETHLGMIGMFFLWSQEIDLLQISAIMNVSVDTSANPHTYELISLINERIFMGHFSLLRGTNFPMYRNSSILNLMQNNIEEQITDLVELAVGETHKYFSTFKLLGEGYSAKDALSCIIHNPANLS